VEKDPFNVIVSGVGGQGNVVCSLLIGAVLLDQGYKVTIGETYGASQRGGSVMSHLRISKTSQYGPLIPPGTADLVLALEPSEAARVLGQFGNGNTTAIVNARPVYPIDVISGATAYPELNGLMKVIESLCRKTYFVSATDKALELGNPILANIIMIGAAAGAGLLSITEAGLAKAIEDHIGSEKLDVNLIAFSIGKGMVQSA
jgi:indolepyruvate ferredoxin oxidoreductase beta subunit